MKRAGRVAAVGAAAFLLVAAGFRFGASAYFRIADWRAPRAERTH